MTINKPWYIWLNALNKETNVIHWGKDSLQQTVLGNGYSHAKKKKKVSP